MNNFQKNAEKIKQPVNKLNSEWEDKDIRFINSAQK